MARYFHQASSQYLSIASAVLTVEPITMACWFFSYDGAPADDQYLIDIHNSASTRFINCFSLIVSGFTATQFGIIALKAGDPGSGQADTNAASGRTWKTFKWHHACGVFASTTDRRAFLDGGDKATDATSVAAPSGLNSTAMGRANHSAPDAYMFGRIADAAIWNAALEDEEISLLASLRARPYQIRPESLQLYTPLPPYGSIVDVTGNFTVVDNGTRVAVPDPLFYQQIKTGRVWVNTAAAQFTLMPQILL